MASWLFGSFSWTPDFENTYSVVFDTLVCERVPSCHMPSIATTDDAQEHDDGAAHGVTLRREQAGTVHAREEARAAQRWGRAAVPRKDARKRSEASCGFVRLPTGDRALDDLMRSEYALLGKGQSRQMGYRVSGGEVSSRAECDG
jgi:hypothetical protein